MTPRPTSWPHPFRLLLLILSGAFTGFWPAYFFLGSEETLARMTAADGLLKVFALRWLGWAVFGSLLATGIGLLSWVGRALGLGHDWASPKRVLRLALWLQVGGSFLGSLLLVGAAQAGNHNLSRIVAQRNSR